MANTGQYIFQLINTLWNLAVLFDKNFARLILPIQELLHFIDVLQTNDLSTNIDL